MGFCGRIEVVVGGSRGRLWVFYEVVKELEYCFRSMVCGIVERIVFFYLIYVIFGRNLFRG